MELSDDTWQSSCENANCLRTVTNSPYRASFVVLILRDITEIYRVYSVFCRIVPALRKLLYRRSEIAFEKMCPGGCLYKTQLLIDRLNRGIFGAAKSSDTRVSFFLSAFQSDSL